MIPNRSRLTKTIHSLALDFQVETEAEPEAACQYHSMLRP
jgi:hypothetical protein